MWKLIEPGAWASVPVQSTWQTSPSRQIVSTILNGPLPQPVVVDPVGERDGLLGDVRAHERAMAPRVRSSSASHAAS